MDSLPKITVVTVTYNAEKSLEKTILSVVNQTYPNIEYIIIDGGSNDKTVNIIKKYAKQIDYWVSEPDKGIYDAMNKGIDKANGEWINFMNAGDCLANEKVLWEIFSKEYRKETGCVFGDSMVLENGKMRMQHINPFWRQKTKIKTKGICHQSCFINTRLAKLFKYDISYKIAADFKLLLDIRCNNYLFYYVPVAVCIFDITGVSYTNPYLCFKEDVRLLGLPLNLHIRLLYVFIFLRLSFYKLVKTVCYILYKRHIVWPYKFVNKTRMDLNKNLKEGYI